MKTKYGLTIENGEGLRSGVWKGTDSSPQYGLVYIVGNAVRNEARGQICEATSSPEFVISVFI